MQTDASLESAALPRTWFVQVRRALSSLRPSQAVTSAKLNPPVESPNSVRLLGQAPVCCKVGVRCLPRNPGVSWKNPSPSSALCLHSLLVGFGLATAASMAYQGHAGTSRND
eukprot:3247298-Amphidinium_carterae.1